jgi:hypothetical protein
VVDCEHQIIVNNTKARVGKRANIVRRARRQSKVLKDKMPMLLGIEPGNNECVGLLSQNVLR